MNKDLFGLGYIQLLEDPGYKVCHTLSITGYIARRGWDCNPNIFTPDEVLAYAEYLISCTLYKVLVLRRTYL